VAQATQRPGDLPSLCREPVISLPLRPPLTRLPSVSGLPIGLRAAILLLSPEDFAAFLIDQPESDRQRRPRNMNRLADCGGHICGANANLSQDNRSAIGRSAQKLKPELRGGLHRDDASKFADLTFVEGGRARRCGRRLEKGREDGVRRHAAVGVDADRLAGPARNRECDVVPIARRLDGIGLALILASLGIGPDAKITDQRFRLSLYPSSPLATATQPRQHFRPRCRTGSVAAYLCDACVHPVLPHEGRSDIRALQTSRKRSATSMSPRRSEGVAVALALFRTAHAHDSSKKSESSKIATQQNGTRSSIACFSFITQNWRAKPLLSYRVIVELIGATTTRTGLTVRCELDDKPYPQGIVVSDKDMRNLNIQRADSHAEWNYTIAPSTPHIKAVDS
jgi:hypothetical protein